MKIALLGYGKENKALHRFLRTKYPRAKFEILDKTRDPKYLEGLERFDIVYRTPGLPYNLPELKRAIKDGVEISSGTRLFLKGARGTVVGVTGTNGKGTTVTLIYEILKAARKEVYLAGNIGKPMIDLLPKLRKNSITILELSSFQLWDVEESPNIAVALDIFPDHLDAHKNFKDYLYAKARIAEYQTKNDSVFYFPDNKHSTFVANKSPGKRIAVTSSALPFELSIPGEHNLRNATMAAAVTSQLGVSPMTVLETIKSFKGNPFRLQYIRTIGGIKFYNDSASTTPYTTIAAMNAFPNKAKVLIMGGREKNLDYRPLIKAIAGQKNVRTVVLYGENKNKLNNSLSKKVSTRVSTSLEKTVEVAYKSAEPGDVIIFSPGATSFDMFNNYTIRGKEFAKIVKNLKPADVK